MGKSKIEWLSYFDKEDRSVEGYTFNPWIGCTKKSAGCKNCYAESMMDHRFGRVAWGKGNPRQRTSAANWLKPLRWNKEARILGVRARVFCASLADVFDAEIDPSWRADLWALVEYCKNLDWLLVTKRPELIPDMVPPSWLDNWPFHLWVGASVEDQEMANERIPYLLKIPAPVRFLSCEPLLGAVDIQKAIGGLCEQCEGRGFVEDSCEGGFMVGCNCEKVAGIDWVIAGGESGEGARPMDPVWARSLRDQCVDSGTAFFFKQWGDVNRAGQWVGKHKAGRDLDGRTWEGSPTPKQR